MTSWTIGGLLTWTADYLKQHGADSPRLDAEVLLAHARDCQRIELYTCFDEEAADDLRDRFRELVRRRAQGTPVAYLVGHREFYSREFQVTPDTLIPRPETEFVLVALLDEVRSRAPSTNADTDSPTSAEPEASTDPSALENEVAEPEATSTPAVASSTTGSPTEAPLNIVDVGTGSGILAICAALELPNSRVIGVDISEAAVTVAQTNAKRHDVEERIEWLVGDLLQPIEAGETFDFILSNPPYIAESERSDLPRDVLDHEPHQALFAGEHGLDVLDRLFAAAATRLSDGGRMILEFSPTQRASLESLAKKHGVRIERFVEDLSKRPRVAVVAA